MGWILWLGSFLGLLLLWALGTPTPTLLVLLVLLPLLTWLFGLPAGKKLQSTLELPATAEKNGEIPVTLVLRYAGRMPIGPVRCCVELQNTLTGETTREILRIPVPPKGEARRTLMASARHCGYLRAEIRSMGVCDWMGLLPGPKQIGAHGGTVLLPELFPVRLHMSLPPTAPRDSMEYAPDRIGYDYSETYDLREYREGDSLKAVHWKLSAKQGKLIIREPSLPVARGLLVFWDKSAGNPGPEAMDALAETAGSLCRALCEEGIPFHLGWDEDRRILMEEIQSTDDFLEALPRLLRKGKGPEDGWGLLEEETLRAYSKILYLGAGSPPQRNGVFAFRYGDAPAGDVPLLEVRPESYREDLQMMELDA